MWFMQFNWCYSLFLFFTGLLWKSVLLPPNKKIKKVIENLFTHNFEIENSEKKKKLKLQDIKIWNSKLELFFPPFCLHLGILTFFFEF